MDTKNHSIGFNILTFFTEFRFFRTLAFRLTLWYAGIFIISSCAVFLLFYFLVSQTIIKRMDQDLLEKAGSFSAVLSAKGISGVKTLAVLEARAAGEKKVFFRLLYPDGEVFASSHMNYWQRIGVSKFALTRLVTTKKNVFDTVVIEPEHYRVRVLYNMAGSGVILQTGLSMETYSSFLATFKRVFSASMAIVIFMSALCGWFMSKKALTGLETITGTAREISGTSLSARVPEKGNHDELDELAATLNQMLDRIEALVKSIREMSDNIAHDLKSPVTRIRGLAEICLVHDSSMEDYQAMAASTIEESDRLLDMINTMLVISRTDAGEGGFRFEWTDLSSLVEQACMLFSPLAEDSDIFFDFNVEPSVFAMVDRGMLQRSLSNIIDNALKYTPGSGRVMVCLELKPFSSLNVPPAETSHAGEFIEIQVSDTGPGIALEDMDKVFQRFYRVDPSRTQKGTGLGLCLARSIAREHGGDVTVSSTPGKGSIFSLILPYCNFPII